MSVNILFQTSSELADALNQSLIRSYTSLDWTKIKPSPARHRGLFAPLFVRVTL